MSCISYAITIDSLMYAMACTRLYVSHRVGVFIHNGLFINYLRESMEKHDNKVVSYHYIVFSKIWKKQALVD